jgi:hypothetical protein
VNGPALVVAMPLRHLESALEICRDRGYVVLPAGGPGDLDRAAAGTHVLLMATEAGEAEVAAATWRCVLVGRVAFSPGDPIPEGVPAAWVHEHPAADPAAPDGERSDDDPDDLDEAGIGPQSFFSVRDLEELAGADRVFANELVPKQQRRGRTFAPRTPRLVELFG